MTQPSTSWKKTPGIRFPLKITFLYVVVGAFWLGITDSLVGVTSRSLWSIHIENYVSDPLFLLISALLIYWICNNHIQASLETQEALRETNERFDALISSSPLAIISLDTDANVISWNPAAETFFGWTACEVVGQYVPYLPYNRQEEGTALRKRILSGESVTGIECCRQRKDGTLIQVSISSAPVHDAAGNISGIVCIIDDITERKRAEERLFMEKERLMVTLCSIGDGVITTDQHGNVVLLNQLAEEMTGWRQAEAEGKPLSEIFHISNARTGQPCQNPVDQVLSTGHVVGLANHTKLLSRDGVEHAIATCSSPIRDRDHNILGVVLVVRDVTQKERIEEELRKADKLESVGVLAGGIAHDFNNLLAAIMGNLTLARLQLSPDAPALPKLLDAEKASLRARELTHQLLTFAKGGSPIKKTASISELIHESASFALIGSKARCDFQINTDLWNADVDEGQIGQVISNLIINAHQAMPEGGSISITATNCTFEDNPDVPLAAGRYVKITISDEGVGIPDEYLSKIFDPYFTTKQQGNGLGLATCYSIIQRHDGRITVESEPSVGTTFTIYLPASASRNVVEIQKPPTQLVTHGKILVIDDEEIIREVVVGMLEMIGYEAYAVSNGNDAIVLYQKAMAMCSPFDAVIMDLTIPGGFGGKEIIVQLRAIDPDVKAIVSSGYSMDPIMADYVSYGFRGVIAKPYKMEELAQLLATILAGTVTAAGNQIPASV